VHGSAHYLDMQSGPTQVPPLHRSATAGTSHRSAAAEHGWLAIGGKLHSGHCATACCSVLKLACTACLQAHYTEVLLRDMAGITFPADRIHSTTVSGEPKASVLARLAAQHPGAADYVFVEDKHSTLEKVRGGLRTAPAHV
jgi:hypothetical protein